MKTLVGALALTLLGSAALAQDISRNVAVSAAVESGHVICAGQCVATGFQINNTSASALWVMLFDAIAVPSDGTVAPKKWYQIAANSTIGVSLGELRMATGLSLACSSTGPYTKTASVSCTFSGDVR